MDGATDIRLDDISRADSESEQPEKTTATGSLTAAPDCASAPHKPPHKPPHESIRACRAWLSFVVFDLLLRRVILQPSPDGRHIPLRLAQDPARPPPLVDVRRGHGAGFVDNAIRTSRYTVLDFVPKQLVWQFSRVGNFYFLCVGIPQTIPGISTTGNFTTILPLLFFVLLTVAKEGYDDYKRHRLDKVENAGLATVLRAEGDGRRIAERQRRRDFVWTKVLAVLLRREKPRRTDGRVLGGTDGDATRGFQWTHVQWRDVRVGDVVKLARDEDVPADLLLLHATGEGGLAYVETMALDGETNLKSKQVPTALADGRCASIDALAQCEADIVVEDPNPDLYKFEGRITVDGATRPLTLAEVVYRGSTLRNTPCAIGLVVNTGEECKSRMNANRHPRAKKPALERVTNRIVILLAVYVVALTAGCSIGYVLWRRSMEMGAWYMRDVTVEAVQIVLGFAIQFNNVIPLALYVSLEIVKLGQMLHVNADAHMYDAVSDTPARCNTNTILENLGQIGYIFSDKTGTLTENVMKFRKMSVAGTSWLHERDLQVGEAETDEAEVDEAETTEAPSPPDGHPDLTTDDLLEYVRLRPHAAFSRRVVTYVLAMALCHTCLPELDDGRVVDFQAASPDELALVRAAQELGFLVVQKSATTTTLRLTFADAAHPLQEVYEVVDVIEFSSHRKRMSVIVRRPDGRLWLICKGADSVVIPRLRQASVALQKAHDVRTSVALERERARKSEHAEPRSSVTIRRSLASSRHGDRASSDARRKSFDVAKTVRRSMDAFRLRPQPVPRATSFDVPVVETVESVGETRLSLPRPSVPRPSVPHPLPSKFDFLETPAFLADDEGAVFDQCFRHMDDFAAQGLRTLLFAHKFLPAAEYDAWKTRYLAAATSLTDRQGRMEDVAESIEQNLELVGATAIEDKLQAGVPETIDKLRRANIKIWMLTGDKRETAINIAHSARLCRPTSDLYTLDATKGDLVGQLVHMAESMGLPDLGTPVARHSWMRRWTRNLKKTVSPATGTTRGHTVVVVDGHTLGVIEADKQPVPVSDANPDPNLRSLFYSIIPSVDSVICCRASPAQKALLVRSIRHGVPGSLGSLGSLGKGSHPGLTLAIGDGANDLAMLAEAHVGIGVSGREGLQAARVADYSIAQFRFLARLLLVHGHWNYMRTAQFILATFYKEMFFYTPAAAYQWWCGYTGTSIYESWSLTVLNTLFTSLSNIVPGIWEQDLGAPILMAVPELYAYGQRGRGLNPGKYFGWMLTAVAQGAAVWFVCWAGYGHQPGRDVGLFAIGDLVFSVGIMWTNVKLLLLDTHCKTVIVLGAFGVTVAGWWLWNAFLSLAYGRAPSPYSVRGGFLEVFGTHAAWWATLVASVAILTVAELGFRALQRNLAVSDVWRGRLRSQETHEPQRRGVVGVLERLVTGKLSWQRALCGGKRASGDDDVFDDDDDETAPAEMSADKLNLGLWQEMEKDPDVKARLRVMNKEDLF